MGSTWNAAPSCEYICCAVSPVVRQRGVDRTKLWLVCCGAIMKLTALTRASEAPLHILISMQVIDFSPTSIRCQRTRSKGKIRDSTFASYARGWSDHPVRLCETAQPRRTTVQPLHSSRQGRLASHRVGILPSCIPFRVVTIAVFAEQQGQPSRSVPPSRTRMAARLSCRNCALLRCVGPVRSRCLHR